MQWYPVTLSIFGKVLKVILSFCHHDYVLRHCTNKKRLNNIFLQFKFHRDIPIITQICNYGPFEKCRLFLCFVENHFQRTVFSRWKLRHTNELSFNHSSVYNFKSNKNGKTHVQTKYRQSSNLWNNV